MMACRAGWTGFFGVFGVTMVFRPDVLSRARPARLTPARSRVGRGAPPSRNMSHLSRVAPSLFHISSPVHAHSTCHSSSAQFANPTAASSVFPEKSIRRVHRAPATASAPPTHHSGVYRNHHQHPLQPTRPWVKHRVHRPEFNQDKWVHLPHRL